MPVTLSYPKPRDILTKVVSIARADSSTEKCVLPKDAVIVSVLVNQTADAVTNTGSFVLGWSGTTSALLSSFTMATTKVGFVAPGTASGSAVGTKLDSDKTVISTYTVGSSTAGGTGYVVINYFVPGPGEGLDS
jgi:hypothetical protein